MGITRLEKDSNDGKVVIDTLIHDAVGRNKYLWQFACFCSAQEKRASIALDGGWGTGKSFFLRQMQVLFDAYSDQPKQLTEDQQNAIKIIFEDYEKNDGLGMSIRPHVCIYYDAWLNDNAEDPMRSILHEIITEMDTNKLFENKGRLQRVYRQISSFFKKQSFSPSPLEALEALCKAADEINPLNPPRIVFPYLKAGKAVLPFLEYLKKNNPVREIDIQKRFHIAFEDYLNKAIMDKNSRLLVLIDELDRCKPTYAVQLLERIKHYLSNDRVTFIFAINDEELQHTIKAFYGEDFNAHQYLDRFFFPRLSLPSIDNLKFRNYYGFQDYENRPLYMEVCDSFLEVHSLSMREELEYRQQVMIICNSATQHRRFANDSNWWLVMYVFLPFLLGLKFKNKVMYSEFIKGKKSDLFLPIITGCRHVACLLFMPSQYRNGPEQLAFHKIDYDVAIKHFNTAYQYLFVDQLKGQTIVEAHPFVFDREMIDVLFSALSFMADFIKFDTNTEEPAHG